MLTILNSLNAHNLPIFQPILMILVSKFVVHRALSDKTYFLLGLLSPLTLCMLGKFHDFFSRLLKFYKINVLDFFLAGIPSESQTVWIKIRPDILSGHIWVTMVCKDHRQTTKNLIKK